MRITQLRGSYNIYQTAIRMAVALSVSSMVGLEVFSSLTNGFDIAADVVVYGVLLYLYSDIWVMDIALITVIASPVFRMLVIFSSGSNISYAAMQALPDAVFFIAFGFCYSFIIYYVFDNKVELSNFALVFFISDIFGNMSELLLRSYIVGHFAFSAELVGFSLLVAGLRAVLAYLILAVMEWYSGNRIRNEKLKEYQALVTNATIIQDEIYIMNKNSADVEDVMKRGYNLYHRLDEEGYPDDIVSESLELARLTHEIKGDYINVISVLSGLYRLEDFDRNLTIREMIRIEEANARALAESRGCNVEISSSVEGDAVTPDRYKLMSVIRNLLTNSIEAMGVHRRKDGDAEKNIIRIKASVEHSADKGETFCTIDIADNGPGVPAGKREKIFNKGYSTKYDEDSGQIQRGMGLSIVKMYVEQDMKGSIELLDEGEQGAHFRVVVPVTIAA